MQSAYYVEGQPDGDPKKLLGTVVRYPITAGQPVTRGSLVGPQDRGFLAAALGPGMRAITVPVNVSSGVAGFVFPGDHVDMVLTQQVEGGGDGPALKVSETIIRNLRVLATDQRVTEQGRRRQDAGEDLLQRHARSHSAHRRKDRGRAEPGSRCRCRSARSPTIRPSWSVRSQPATSRSRQAPIRRMRSRCCSPWPTGRADGNTTFSTGGDVSRFQRRTVPARQQDKAEALAKAMGSLGKGLGQAIAGQPGAGQRSRRPRRSRQQCHRRSGGSSLR